MVQRSILLWWMVIVTTRIRLTAVVAATVTATTVAACTTHPDDRTLPCVTVGVFYSSTGAYGDTGQRTLAVLSAWALLVSQKPQIGFRVRIIAVDVRSDAALIPSACMQLRATNATVLVAPESALTIPANQCANEARIPIISRVALSDAYRCTLPAPFPPHSNCRNLDDRAYQFAFTVLQPASVQFRDYYSLVRIAGARTAAVVYFDDLFHTEACVTGAMYADLNRISVLETFRIPQNYTTQTIRDIVARLQLLQPDAVTWCNRLGCAEDIAVFKAADYLPRSLIMLQCTDTPRQVAAFGGADLKYIAGALFWSDQVTGPTYTDHASRIYASHFPRSSNGSSAGAFVRWLSSVVPAPITFTDASTLAVGYFIEAAIHGAAPSLDPIAVNEALARVNLNCFWGSLVADTYGMVSLNAVLITQLDSEMRLQLLSPISTATAPMVYPIPSWQERVYVCRYASTIGARITLALLVVVAAFYLASLALAVVSVKLITDPSLPMMCASLLGALLASAGVLTWLDENTPVTCNARIPVLSLGFTLLLLPMTARSWILHRVVQNVSIHRVNGSNSLAHWKVLISMVLPIWLMVTVLSVRYPLQTERLSFDSVRPSTDLTVCVVGIAHRTGTLVCASILGVMVTMIVVIWISLAVRNRSVSHPLLAETQRVLLGVALLVLLLGVLLAVEFGLANASREIVQMKQVIRGLGLLLSVALCILVLHGPRLVRIILLTTRRSGTQHLPLPPPPGPPREMVGLGKKTGAVMDRRLSAVSAENPSGTVEVSDAQPAQLAFERDPPNTRVQFHLAAALSPSL